MKKNKKSIK